MGEARQVRRAGRVQQVAYDKTPLHTGAPDIDARTGWLLLMSRLYGGHPDGNSFVAALAEHGVVASRSLLSRWESGELAVPFEALAAYETVLELDPGRLTGLVAHLRSGAGARSPRPVLDPAGPAFPDRLDELVDLAEDGKAQGAEWQQLGWHLTAAPLVHLRRHSWQTLARRVIGVAPRAVGHAQLLYDNAVSDLALLPRSRDALLDAIETHLGDPNAQVLTSPFHLLARIPDERAGDLVLAMFAAPPSQPMMVQSISMVKGLLERGRFTDEQRGRLGMEILRQWRSEPERSPTRLAELVAVLPEGLRASLTSAADKAGQGSLGYVVRHAEAPSTDRDALVADIAGGARRRTPGDPVHAEDRMLPRLVRELLYHRDGERRHLATRVLAASPFAAALCDELLELLPDARGSAEVRLNASWALRYLARGQHRMRLLRLHEEEDEPVRALAVLALGHIGFDGVSDQVLRSSLDRTLTNTSRAVMYALGMTGSPGLVGMMRSASTPDWQSAAAAWWVRQGPAVHS